jgi:hypothetical protein
MFSYLLVLINNNNNITDLSKLFEAYLHFLLYKKTPNTSINYNSFLCDAFIFLRSRKILILMLFVFPRLMRNQRGIIILKIKDI